MLPGSKQSARDCRSNCSSWGAKIAVIEFSMLEILFAQLMIFPSQIRILKNEHNVKPEGSKPILYWQLLEDQDLEARKIAAAARPHRGFSNNRSP